MPGYLWKICNYYLIFLNGESTVGFAWEVDVKLRDQKHKP